MDRLRTVEFCELHLTNAPATHPESESAYNYHAALPSHVVLRKMISIDEGLNVIVSLLS